MQEERRIADQMFREMLLAGANRPSIIMWSMSNECPFVWAYANRAYNQRLAQDARELIGDGRLVTQSPAADSWRLSLVTEDPIDVAGWTTYYGVFYDGDTTQDMYEGTRDFIARHAAARPELPIVSTEYGFWSGEDDALLEEQREAMEATFRAFRENAALDENGAVRPDGYVAAATWWTAFNWFTKNGLPDFIAGYLEVMGAIHMDRTHEKPVAAALRAAYEPYFEFGGLGPVPDDYVDEEEPTDDDASPDDDDDDNNDSANPSIDDDDDDDNGGCGC
jgi:beta-glucuronidase